MLFEQLNLHASINKALSTCGYTKPTPVQAKAIPEILKGSDVVVSAQTGTGKTAAFVLPALQYLIEHLNSPRSNTKAPRILILTPTRELAEQITQAIKKTYGKFMQVKIANLVGGVSYETQTRDLMRGVDIVVATPGRLLDHITRKRVSLSQIDMLILDEADRMLDMGFIDDVRYITQLTPAKRQTLLFSATMDNKLMSVIRDVLKEPVRIDLSCNKVTVPLIKQEMYKANNLNHKSRLLKHILNDKTIYKAIIFSATKINADRLAAQLCEAGFAAAALHGGLRQRMRYRTLEELRHGKIQYLIATDVAARGIDINDITHVFNYDLPKFCEDYVHRIGRTGRAGKEGVAISFVLPTDMRHLQRIERYTGQRIKLMQEVSLPSAATADEKFVQSDDGKKQDKKQDKKQKEMPYGRKNKIKNNAEYATHKKASNGHEYKRKHVERKKYTQEEGRGFSKNVSKGARFKNESVRFKNDRFKRKQQSERKQQSAG